jgi:hypothetical protein
MKILRVFSNARKKCFVVETKSGIYEFPYSNLKLKPLKNNLIVEVFADREVQSKAFTYRLEDGKEDSILLEEVLHFNKDPEILRKHLLYKLTLEAQKELINLKLTKRALSRRLNISPSHLYRLLDQTFYGKTVDQMIKVLLALGREVEFQTRAA